MKQATFRRYVAALRGDVRAELEAGIAARCDVAQDQLRDGERGG